MKKSKLLYVLLIAAITALSGLWLGCGGDESGSPTVTEGSETGVYYYDSDEGEYLVTLSKGSVVTMLTPETNDVGVYTVNNADLTFTFDTAQYTAKLNGDMLAVDMGEGRGVWNYTKRITYTVTFNTNGGSAVGNMRVVNGKTIDKKPQDPTNGEKVFIGWYTDADYTKPFVFGADPVKSDMTLYARWVEPAFGRNEVNVGFNLDYDGAPELESKRTVGGKLYDIPAPTRNGYSFEGWWVKVYDTAQNERFYSYRVTADTVFEAGTTLYALWQSTEVTAKLLTPIVDVTATGISWRSNANASAYKVRVTAPDGSDVVNEERYATTSMTVNFADLDEGNYYISVIAVASSGNADNNSEPAVRCYANKTLAPVTMFTFVEPSTLVFNAVDGAERYLLDIKCGDANHKHTQIDIGSSTSFNFVNCMMKEGGIEFTVTAVATGRAPSVSETVYYKRPLAAVTGLGYNSESETLYWNGVASAVGYTVELSCGNDGHSHNVKVDVGSKTSYSVKSCEGCDGAITVKVTPYTKGYNSPAPTEIQIYKTSLAAPYDLRIVGNVLSWESDKNATGFDVYIAGQTVSSATSSIDLSTITGINWEQGADYNIRVRANSADKSSQWSDPVDARYYALYSSLGYDAGTVSWRRVIGAVKYNVRVNDGRAVEIADGANSYEVTLTQAGINTIYVNFVDTDNKTSSWAEIEINAEELQFDLRGGTGEVPAQYYALGDRVRLPDVSGISRTGYTFGGWYTSPYGADGLGAKYTDERFGNVGGLMLYASWEPVTYKITFENGILPVNQKEGTATYRRPFSWPIPTSDDTSLVFAGWYSDPDGLEIAYTDENGNSISDWSVSRDMTVYACWNSIFSFELLKNGTYRIAKNTAYWAQYAPSDLKIPASYTAPGDRSRKVTEIGSASFTSSNMLKTVRIPDSIKYVDTNGFNNSTNIERFIVYEVDGTTIPEYSTIDGVLYRDRLDDFGNLQEKDLWIYPRAKTTVEFVIPDGVTALPANALYLAKVTKVIIPTSVIRVEGNAFRSCSSLTDVVFADGGEVEENGSVKELIIEKQAFYSCSKLSCVKIPARLASFNPEMFVSCNSFSRIEVETNSQKYGAVSGFLTDAAKTTILYCPIKAVVGTLTLPAGITVIGEGAFAANTQITSVELPFYAVEIKDRAFNKCTRLTSVSFIKDISDPFELKIGNNAFEGCTLLKTFDFTNGNVVEIGDHAFDGCTGLEKFEFPETLTKLGEYAFNKCTKLNEVTIPSSLGKVGNYAFAGCTNLVTVKFGTPATGATPALELGDYSFNGCTGMLTISLPAYVTEIGEAVFGGCTKLAEIIVDDNNASFETFDGVLFTKGFSKMLFYPLGRTGEFTLPEAVTELSAQLFKGNTSLTAIVIGKNVISIGNEAFMNCTALKTVTFENENDITLGTSVFEGCTALETVTLNDNIKKLPNRMFYNDQAIQSITLPSGLTHIGDYALYYLSTITSLKIPATVEHIGYAAFKYCRALTDLTFEINEIGEDDPNFADYPKNITFGKDAKNQYAETFSYCGFTGITLPVNISEITDGMFMYCQALTDINIPQKITVIGAKAFYSCTNLINVQFESDVSSTLTLREAPDSTVTPSSSTGVFSGCSVLRSVNLDARKIDSVPQYMFYNCRGLTSITIPASVKNTKNTEGEITVFAVQKSAFEFCVSLVTVTFDSANDNPVSIGPRAFYGCSKMTAINLPKGLAKIPAFDEDGNDTAGYYNVFGADAFTNCSVLKEINVAPQTDEPVTAAEGEDDGTVGDVAKTYYYSYDGILCVLDQTADAEGNTSTIRELVLCPTSRTKAVTIPYNITNINEHAFTKAFNITSLTFEPTPDGATEVDLKINDAVKTGTDEHTYGAFNWFIGITTLTLPARLTYIGDYAFYDCSMVHTLTLGDNSRLKHIGNYAFAKCGGLRGIKVPATVETIGDSAFDGCSGISTFTFDDNSVLQTIGARAFAGTSFTDIAIPNSVTTLGANLFYDSDIRSVALPSSLIDFDQATLAGCADLTTVTLSGNDKISIEDSVIYNTDKTELIMYPINKSDENFVILDTVTSIADNAFKGNAKLKTVTIPNTVATIGEGAFADCTSLTTVTFVPDSDSDTCATELNIGGTADETGVFQNCGDLVTVGLPKRLTRLGKNAFANCVSLSALTFDENSTIQAINGGVFGNAGGGKLVLPSSVKQINEGAFTGSLFTEVEMTGVTTIAKDAFRASGITRIVIPNTVETIGETALAECSELTYAEIKLNTVTELTMAGPTSYINNDTNGNKGLFANCPKLQKAVIATNGEIPYHMFYKCNSLAELEIKGSGTIKGPICYAGEKMTVPFTTTAQDKGLASLKKVTIDNTITKIGSYAFDGCYNLGKHKADECVDEKCRGDADHGFIIAKVGDDKITELGSYAFKNTAIQSFIIPSSVTTLSMGLFRYNTALTTVTIPTKSFTSTNSYAFEACTSLSVVNFVDEGVNSERKLVTIGSSAFKDCTSLKSFDLTGFTTLSSSSFDGSGLTSIVIPDIVKSFTSASAFANCKELLSVSIPTDSFAKLPTKTFKNCEKLKTVTFTGNGSVLTTIDTNVFEGCVALTDITIPNGVTTINDNVFLNSGVTNLTLPGSVSTIATQAFVGCNITSIRIVGDSQSYTVSADMKALLDKDGKTLVKYIGTDKSYTVPDGIESIGDNAFAGCTTLENITFCEGLKSIGSNAFKDCSGLKSVILPDLESIGTYAFAGSGVAEVTIAGLPEASVNYIFDGCANLNTVTFTGGAKTIGGYMFRNATALETVVFAADIETIDKQAFAGCLKLDGITFPASIKTVNAGAFMNCTSLSSITIPATVETLGTGVFAGCTALETVSIAASTNKLVVANGTTASTSETSATRGLFGGCTLLENIDISKRPIYTTASATVVTVPNYMFNGCVLLSNVKLHSNTDSIGNYAFKDCISLSTLPLSTLTDLKTLNTYAFSGTVLVNVTLPEGLVTIGTYVFMDCEDLMSINIPGTVKTINSAAFAGCTSLTTVTFEEDDGNTGLGFATGSVALSFNPSGTLTKRGVFGGCTSLQSIDLSTRCAIYGSPTSTTSTYKNVVSNYLFADCTNLKSVKLPAGIVKINAAAFFNTGLTSFTLDEKTTTIGNAAFADCSQLVTFTIPKSSTNLYLSGASSSAPTSLTYYGAFQNCTSLTEMELANRPHVYHGSSGTSKYLPAYLFYNCTSLRRVTLPDEITRIYGYAFYGCEALEEINFPTALESIYLAAFQGSGLTEVVLPDNVKEICESAFRDCARLESLTLSSSLKYVLKYAFMDCTSLKSLHIPAGIATIGDAAFAGCTGLVSLTFEENASPLGFAKGSGTEGEDRGVFAGCTSLTALDLTPIVVRRIWYTKYSSTNNSWSYSNSYTINSAMPEYMFYGCTSLQSIKLSDVMWFGGGYSNGRSYDDKTFADCTSLKEITFPENSDFRLGDSSFENCGFETLTIPSNLAGIGGYTFAGNKNLVKLTVESKDICDYIRGFSGCDKLTEVVLPDGIKGISLNAFQNCVMLSNINLPDSLEYIDSNAFENTALESVIIPEHVRVYSAVFKDCKKLKTVVFDGTSDNLGWHLFEGCTALTSVTLPADLEYIPQYMFYGCTALVSIELPATVSSIGDYAFAGCTALAQIIIPAAVTEMGEYVFEGWTATQTIYIETLAAAPEGWSEYWNYNSKQVDVTPEPEQPEEGEEPVIPDPVYETQPDGVIAANIVWEYTRPATPAPEV